MVETKTGARRKMIGKKSTTAQTVNTDNFGKRYDALERRRTALIARLDNLGAFARAHPSSRKALILLNQKFRKADIVQRVALLQAADWLIGLIEFGSTIV
jgi:hypothetical protein